MARARLRRGIVGCFFATAVGAFTACGDSDRNFGEGVADSGGSSGSETGGAKMGTGAASGGRSSGGARTSGGASNGGSSGAGGRSGSGGAAGAGGSVPDG